MSSKAYSFAFAVVICVVTSLVLSVASELLRDRRQLNIEVDRQKNVLMALDIIKSGQWLLPDRVVTLYQQKVQERFISQTGEFVTQSDRPVFLMMQDNKLERYAIPINGKGVWGDIKGYLAIDKDGATVVGMTIYTHQETPGLGGEIEKKWFRESFSGKRIVNEAQEFKSITVVKGRLPKTLAESIKIHQVDGISGATRTGISLTVLLRNSLEKYEPYAAQLRQKAGAGT